MVAFGQTLEGNLVKEWRDKYVRYEKLKEVIDLIGERAVKDDMYVEEDDDAREVGNMLRVLSSQSLLDLAERSNNGELAIGAREQMYAEEKGYGSIRNKPRRRREVMRSGTVTSLRSRFWAIIETDLARACGHASSLAGVLREQIDALIKKYRRNDPGGSMMANAELNQVRKIFAQMLALQNFVQLNGIALRKAVKKFDKTCVALGLNPTLPVFMERLKDEPLLLVTKQLAQLEALIGMHLVSRDKLLKWRVEEAASVSSYHQRKNYGRDPHEKKNLLFDFLRPHGSKLFALLILALGLAWPIVPNDLIASRAAAVVACILILWISNSLPYHATAFAVPALVVLFRCLRENDHSPASPQFSAKVVVAAFFGESTFLLLGGYTMSAAISRCELEVFAANALRYRLGHSPKKFLLAVMILACIISAILSNSTAAVLCVAVLEPCLARSDHDSKFAKSLLLGLALACNVGGMLSPIASMQNIISVSTLADADITISFGQWILFAAPIGILSTICSWAILSFFPGSVKPNDVLVVPGPPLQMNDSAFISVLSLTKNNNLKLKATKTADETAMLVSAIDDDDTKLSQARRKFFITSAVSIVSLGTILLWSLGGPPYIFGDVALVSLTYMSILFGTGFLTDVDLNSLPWNTLCVLGGSNVLGLTVQSSHLLDYIANGVLPYLPDGATHPSQFLIIIVLFVSTVATFVSHTVAAIIVMPLVVKLAQDAGIATQVGLAAALSISSASALPFSSLPNINSLTKLDSQRIPFLNTHNFLFYGALAQLATALLIILWSPIGVFLFIGDGTSEKNLLALGGKNGDDERRRFLLRRRREEEEAASSILWWAL